MTRLLRIVAPKRHLYRGVGATGARSTSRDAFFVARPCPRVRDGRQATAPHAAARRNLASNRVVRSTMGRVRELVAGVSRSHCVAARQMPMRPAPHGRWRPWSRSRARVRRRRGRLSRRPPGLGRRCHSLLRRPRRAWGPTVKPGPRDATAASANSGSSKSGFLEVQAPAPLGGWCAGEERLPYLTAPASGMTTLSRASCCTCAGCGVCACADASFRPRESPSPARIVNVQMIFPAGTECNEGPALGGTPPPPTGLSACAAATRRSRNRVEKPGYGKRIFRLESNKAPRDSLIDRGAEWIGRVLDPEGKPLEVCHVELRTARYTGVSLESGCTPRGFMFHDIPPGDLLLKVRARAQTASSLAPSRVLRSTVHFAPNERRAEDIRWPTGLDVAGQVVDAAGRPIAAAWLRVFSRTSTVDLAEAPSSFAPTTMRTFALHHLEARQMTPSSWSRRGYSEARVVVEAGSREVQADRSAPVR